MISYYQFKKICDKLIVTMALPKLGEKKICETLIVAMPLPKQGEKKNCFGNCGNVIAENEKKKKCFGNCGNVIAENGKKKILFWQLWQWHCQKWGKKKKMLRNL